MMMIDEDEDEDEDKDKDEDDDDDEEEKKQPPRETAFTLPGHIFPGRFSALGSIHVERSP